MSQIQVTDLTFAYEGSYDNIFEDVSFNIDTDWRLGFIGRNGRGKTTFLNLLMGKHEYSGSIHSNVSFEYFPYVVSDTSRMTSDIVEEIAVNIESWQLLRELSHLDMDDDVLYRPFNTLSNGERTKVMLAVLFAKENNFLLIDEPTNHLDAAARDIVSQYLRSKKGFILVSHDRKFLDECVDHIISINRTNIEIQKGNFSSWYENKMAQDDMETAQNRKLKAEIGRLSEAASRASSWSDKVEKSKKGTGESGNRPDRGYIGHKSAKMMKRSKSLEGRKREMADEKSKLLRNIESAEELKLMPQRYHSEVLAELDKVSIYYDDNAACENVSFDIRRQDRIALSGPNSSGKSSILKLLLGDDISHLGRLEIGSNLKISYVPQDASYLGGDLKDFIERHEIDEPLFKAILRKLDFDRIMFEKDISDFSAGQKKKLLIAKSLCEKAHLYIWDEPLNYIDIFSRIQIEDLLLEYEPTILFVEHDSAFSEKVATKNVLL